MQSVRGSSDLPATQVSGQRHTGFSGSIHAMPRLCFPRSTAVLRRWCVILGSLREHIRIQFSTEAVDLGPVFAIQDGNPILNTRTNAHAEGIRILQATRPKADFADLQTFLAGFDAGERYALDSADSHSHSTQGELHIQRQPQESLRPHLP